MNFWFWVFIFCTSLLQAVSLPSERRALLESAEKFLHQGNPSYEASLAKLDSPFALKAVHDDQVLRGLSGGSSDPEILRRVAESLHPTGTIVKGDKRLLLFDENSLEEGDVIKISLQGKVYRVKIEKIESNAYTLRLNSSTYTQTLVQVDPKKVKFDDPSR
jgi:hypothetical protein